MPDPTSDPNEYQHADGLTKEALQKRLDVGFDRLESEDPTPKSDKTPTLKLQQSELQTLLDAIDEPTDEAPTSDDFGIDH